MAFQMSYTKKGRNHPESYWVLNVKNFTRSEGVGRIEFAGYHNEAAYLANKEDILDTKGYPVTEEMTDEECEAYAVFTQDIDISDEEMVSFFAGAESV